MEGPDSIYAVYTNINRASINEAVFINYLKQYHTKKSRKQRKLPEYTVYIMSTISQMQVGGKVWHECNNATKILYIHVAVIAT